jgi:hypothetical protein
MRPKTWGNVRTGVEEPETDVDGERSYDGLEYSEGDHERTAPHLSHV